MSNVKPGDIAITTKCIPGGPYIVEVGQRVGAGPQMVDCTTGETLVIMFYPDELLWWCSSNTAMPCMVHKRTGEVTKRTYLLPIPDCCLRRLNDPDATEDKTLFLDKPITMDSFHFKPRKEPELV